MTPQALQLRAKARLRLKQKQEQTGIQPQPVQTVPVDAAGQPAPSTGGPPTMERSRVTQAFEAAADPRANQMESLVPEPLQYGFTQNLVSQLPFGDEYSITGNTIGRYLSGKFGRGPDVSLQEANNAARAQEHAAQEQYRQAHPWGDIGGQTLGVALAQPAGGAAAFGTLLRAPATAPVSSVAKTFLPTKGSIGRLGQATLAGEVMGGLQGASEGDSAKERAFNALQGIAGGGLTGLAVSPAVEAAGLGLRSLLASPTSALGNRFRPQGRATAITEEAFRRDNVPIADAAARIAAGGGDMVLADVGGANVRGLARTAVNTPGAARERITKFVEERGLQQPQRIVNAVTSVLRNPADFGKTAARMAAERERIASPIYERAKRTAKPVNISNVVKAIDDRVGPLATPLSDLRPTGIEATLNRLRTYFQTSKSSRFDIAQLHRVKMEMDGMIAGAIKEGDGHKVAALKDVQRELLRSMDKASPDYERARGIYSSSHEIDEALQIGRNAFRMTPDDMRSALNGMTSGQREAVQIGLARAVQDQMDKYGATEFRSARDVLKTVFGTPQVMKTLRAAFQDERAFRRFQATLFKEGRMARTGDAVRGNSTTAAQIANLMDFQKGVGPDVIGQLMQGRPMQAVATVLRQSLYGEKGMNEKVADKIADMLLSNDPAKLQRAIQLLNMRQGALQRALTRIGAISKFTSNEAYGAGPDVARRTPVVNRLFPASPGR